VTIDATTRAWVANLADEKAAANGCRFDEARGQFVVDWIERFCALYEGEYAGQKMTLDDWQYDATMRLFGWLRWSKDWNRWVRRFTRASIWIPKKNGKPISTDTPIPTPDGWKLMGDLRIGDTVFDEDGAPCRIIDATGVLPCEECYRLNFSDDTSIVAGAGHEWYVKCVSRGKAWRVLETAEMYRTQTVAAEQRANYLVAVNGCLRTPDADLPIDPFLLGAWLGNGATRKGQIDVFEDDHATAGSLKAQPFPVTSEWKNTGRSRTYQLTGLQAALKALGVFDNKHIPQAYLRASERQRWALLQGLMDTDGCIGPKGQCIYVTALDVLKDGVVELVRSLGIKATANLVASTGKGKLPCWRILFTGYEGQPVSRLERKLRNLPPRPIRPTRASVKTIVSIEPVPTVPVRCISVDSPSHLFLAGEGMIPTHNSPTLAAWGLYLFCGDGEPGQKVYSTAKDGKQALIAHTHAVEMVKRSPELLSECKINQSSWQLAHLPSSSVFRVVAGDNPQSQEGLNGSICVDECHVVDRRLMSILKGAGISRSEPLQIEVSTAGNNPDGYGKSQWDYGQGVNAGDFEDQGFLYIAYSAPQELSDEELDRNLLDYAKQANPTLGRIVKEEEFVASYNAAKRSLSDLLDFKMYRLNIWQRSSNPWLKASDWAKCKQTFTEKDLEGRECVAALDLSRTRDMSALVLLFPDEDGEGFTLLPYFWLPEEAAREQGHLAPFLPWADAGHLMLTPGNVVDYTYIKKTIREKAELFAIRELTFDQTYAEELTQWVENEIGVPRVAYPQTILEFAAPTKEFERLVIAGKLRHNGHPVMTWQAGHVQVRSDVNCNIRPVKPKRDDVRKIDGVVAAVMALGRLIEEGPAQPCSVESW
jgi:phage terminase large subunit-like protein